MKVILGIVLVSRLIVAFTFGTISPCGTLRAEVRKQAAREGGMGALFAALPDPVLNGILAAQFGSLTPARCIVLAFSPAPVRPPPPNATPPLQTPEALPNINTQNNVVPFDAAVAARQAGLKSSAAIKNCRDRRTSGILKSFTASAACSNPRIIQAYRKANYRYMDLVFQWTSERAEVSEKLGQGQLTEAQGNLEMSQFTTKLIDEQRARNRGQK